MSLAFFPAEHENKYVFPNNRSAILRSFLAKRYEPDAVYPVGRISSIYFDTLALSLLGEKLNSDYLKAKVRLRWYSSVETRTPFPALFLEVKRKVGSSREKKRYDPGFPSSQALERPLHDPFFLQINQLLTQHGELPGEAVLPVLQVDYLRYRFVDPLTGTRLAVDSDIRVGRVNGRILDRGPNHTPLKEAVFECKSRAVDLPDWLTPIITVANGRRDAFSKYAACYLQVRQLTF